jgi:hypothetical protein
MSEGSASWHARVPPLPLGSWVPGTGRWARLRSRILIFVAAAPSRVARERERISSGHLQSVPRAELCGSGESAIADKSEVRLRSQSSGGGAEEEGGWTWTWFAARSVSWIMV